MTFHAGRPTPPTASDSAVDQALAYVAAGLPVFPVFGAVPDGAGGWACACGTPAGPGHNEAKHPATAHGHHDAELVTPARAEAWFRDGTRNLALPGGDGLVVVDVDPRHGGFDTLDEWESWTSGTSLPATLRCETGSGGLHLYYHAPAGARVTSRNGVLPGVDVKAEGGYVVGATGRHVAGGLYRWVDPDVPVATLPADLLAWLLTRRGGAGPGGGETPDGYDFRAGGRAGQRDAYANDVAFRLRKSGVSWARAERAMREAWEGMDQPAGDPFEWEVALDKLRRVWESVPPDDAVSRPWWPGVLDPGLPPSSDDAVVPGSRGDGPPGLNGGPGDPGPPVSGQVLAAAPPDEHASDLGNANRLARLLGDRVRYVPAEDRWYVWDGSTLVLDDMNRVQDMTRLVIADLRDQVLTMPSGGDRDRFTQWCLTSESLPRRQAMVSSAEFDPRVTVSVAALDADPMLLVVENGTVELASGRVRESRLGDLCTRRAAVRFDETATCPRWLAHVETVCGGDPDLSAYLQRAAGYTLTGLVDEQVYLFLHGEGNNGKNVFVETLTGLLGTYAQVAAPGLLTGGDGDHPTVLADLRGARLVMSDETKRGAAMNDARVKMLTGSAKVRARFMRQDFFEYDSTMKLWILGNAKPTVADTSEGMWRRMHLVPFTAVIGEDQRVKHYEKVLRAERSGVLNWCLEGLRAWRALGGLGRPPAVRRATAEYRLEEDHVGQFLADQTTREDGAWTPNAALYQSYQLWCGLQGLRRDDVLNNVYLGRELATRGYGKRLAYLPGTKTQVRGVTGLALRGVDQPV